LQQKTLLKEISSGKEGLVQSTRCASSYTFRFHIWHSKVQTWRLILVYISSIVCTTRKRKIALRPRLVSMCEVLGCHIRCHIEMLYGVFGY
jgi:hypothetical protein